ncbi:hypothetical protein ACL9RL_19570 [Plantibacter sp. Mn2098]|uniref:hypothetical protein n=1 Tax=Plantibacter sp. Mn2098 TaxID=3395266 RepID=UPI003BBECD9D
MNDLVGPVATTNTQTDPADVKSRLAGALDDAQNVLGGTWDPKDAQLADGCGDVNDDTHFSYMSARYRNEPTDDYLGSTASLKKFWEDQDIVVSEVGYYETHRVLDAVMPWGDHIYFKTSEGRVWLTAETVCYPGNWVEIRKEEGKALLATQTPSPTP